MLGMGIPDGVVQLSAPAEVGLPPGPFSMRQQQPLYVKHCVCGFSSGLNTASDGRQSTAPLRRLPAGLLRALFKDAVSVDSKEQKEQQPLLAHL